MSKVSLTAIVSTLLGMVLLSVATAQPVLAHDPMPQIERPIPGIAPPGPEDPLVGEITPEVEPLHISPTPHIHVVDNIYHTYDGVLPRGEVGSQYNPGPTVPIVKFEIIRTVSNGWSVNIGFSKEPVQAAVGYNVEWSEGRLFGTEIPIPVDTTVHVFYEDWFHVQEYNCHTDWAIEGRIYRENGQGWAAQWFKGHIYHTFTPGNTP